MYTCAKHPCLDTYHFIKFGPSVTNADKCLSSEKVECPPEADYEDDDLEDTQMTEAGDESDEEDEDVDDEDDGAEEAPVTSRMAPPTAPIKST